MIRIKLSIWRDSFRNIFINNCIQDKFRFDNDIKLYILEKSYKIVDDYTKEWEKIGMPMIVIEKFNEWHNRRVQTFIDGIEDVFNSNSFSSVEEKINVILTLFNSLIYITIFDAEKTLGTLNGTLSGIEYKGKIIE